MSTIAVAACAADRRVTDHFMCDRHAEVASGNLADDIVGRWHLVRHYTDTRYYDFHRNGTVDVWYVGLDEDDTHATVGWSVSGSMLTTTETPPSAFAMSLDPSPIGPVWRASAEYVFYPCAPA